MESFKPGSRDGSWAEHWKFPGAALGLRWVHRERPWARDMESGQRPVSLRVGLEEQMPTPEVPGVSQGKAVRWCTGISLQLILLCTQIPTSIHSKKDSLENLFNLVLTVGFGCCGVLLLSVSFWFFFPARWFHKKLELQSKKYKKCYWNQMKYLSSVQLPRYL